MTPAHPSIYQRATCRGCRGSLEEILSLGDLRLNGFPRFPWEIDQTPKVPLVLTLCMHCGLVQLDRTVPPDWMYREYWYRSGVNEMMRRELEAVVREGLKTLGRLPKRVLDIGANDGTLLDAYQRIIGDEARDPVGIPDRYAVEPALNLHSRLRAHCDVLIPDYFPLASPPGVQFDLITAIAMCYDVEDPLGFFGALHDLLAPGGLAIVQFQDLGQQIRAVAFDNICHEHLLYYSCWSLLGLVQRAGLQIVHVTQTPINGGSLRVQLRRQEDAEQADVSVSLQLMREAQQHLATPEIRSGERAPFRGFTQRVEAIKTRVGAILDDAASQGTVIDLYGASTKGNILLQTLGVGPEVVRQAIDRSPEKTGRLTMTGIPIVGEETARAEPAGLWLCPIWQFREGMLERERWYLEGGGTILFPLPTVEVLQQRGDDAGA